MCFHLSQLCGEAHRLSDRSAIGLLCSSYWFKCLMYYMPLLNGIFASIIPTYTKQLCFTISIILVQLTPYIPVFIVLGILNINYFKELSQPLAFESWYFQLVTSLLFGFMLPFYLFGQMVLTKTKKNRAEPSVETGNQQLHLNIEEPSTHQTTSKSSIILIGNNEISKLDFKAAQNFYFFVKMHFIFMALKLILLIRIYICLHNKKVSSSENQGPAGSEDECSFVIKVFYFTGALLDCFYSSIVNPAAFLFFTLIKEGGPIIDDGK